MGEATLVFDPFSQEFFDDPYEFYRWMRSEAPVYYSDQYDFYALTRHEDVAGIQELRNVLLRIRCGPRHGASRRTAA